MSSLRAEILIDANPDCVWEVVRDAASISEWYPLISGSSLDSRGVRQIELSDGSRLEEKIVTSNEFLRRFQYQIQDGDLPVEHHLGTIDVIPIEDKTLVVYSTEITPDSLALLVDSAVKDALAGLRDATTHTETPAALGN
ncbi:SRPBCC family protein [Rhodococcus baikonurensis]|uniref:SRPBCC family protein n=1 Tax=Rhodococcus erythropolis group TaxID=2840174 RepID=UPI000BB3C212|nr:SRPBCC family protein [Rhodococcus erythropolis]PBI86873.1 Polyketide cyclase / dehydrase and lipid transport [Rhodococcus erythropolis]